MPRKARLLVPNCPHHIVQRGHNRKVIFLADADYQFYLDNLLEFRARYDISVYAYCLMTNHVHLVLEPGEDARTLSLLMKRLAGRHTAYINKQEGRSGTLWEGRFKASPIQRDNYLLACCRYVELNPVKAGMVRVPEAYQWSSYLMRIGQSDQQWLDSDPCYLRLANRESLRRARYVQFINDGICKTDQTMIQQAIQRNQLTGNQRFADEIERRLGQRVEQRGRGRPKKLAEK